MERSEENQGGDILTTGLAFFKPTAIRPIIPANRDTNEYDLDEEAEVNPLGETT